MRITFEQAREWYGKDLLVLGQAAQQFRLSLHPEPVVTYVVDRNINYTNVCISGCHFCAFYQGIDSPGAYVLSFDEMGQKIRETLELGGTQILLQGGLHPNLSLTYYENLLQWIKTHFNIHIHGFSPPEILHMARISNLSLREVISRLKEAGLGSIPGGGAEILSERVRRLISPLKGTAADWLKVMETAHELGLKTTATMMFGHIETVDERIDHLMAIRNLQDRTRGFTAFIPWTFQPGNTRLSLTEAKGVEYLRMLALSRLVLDNIPNIQASWVTQGPKVAQIALYFGANDLGSTMIEENVVAATGVANRLSLPEMRRLIETAGYAPCQRDTFYNKVE